MIHFIHKVGAIASITLLYISCARNIYPGYITSVDSQSHRINLINNKLYFTYEESIDEPQFIYPSCANRELQAISIPAGHFRHIIREIGLTTKDTLLYVNPFSLAYLTKDSMTPEYDNVLDFAHCDSLGMPAMYRAEYIGLIKTILPGWLVYQKITVNRRRRCIIFQHFIPYRNRYLCVCYVLQGVTKQNKYIVPRIYFANYNVTESGNLVYLYNYIETYIKDTRTIIRRIHNQ